MSASTCVPSLPNIAVTSAGYAQMTGLLAGFAFTALVVLLTPTQAEHRPRDKQHSGYLFTALFSAFVALLMTTLTYCLLAGEDVAAAPGRAVTEELVDGLPFGLAFITLFHGLTLLLHVGKAHASVVRTVHNMTVLALPPMALFYLVSAVPDTEATRASLSGGCPDAQIYILGLILTVLCSAVLLLSMAAKTYSATLRRWVPKRLSHPSIVALIVSLISAMFAGTLAGRSPNYLLSRTWLVAYLLAAALLLTGIGFLLICGGPGHFAERAVGVAPVRQPPLTAIPQGFWFDYEPRMRRHLPPRSQRMKVSERQFSRPRLSHSLHRPHTNLADGSGLSAALPELPRTPTDASP